MQTAATEEPRPGSLDPTQPRTDSCVFFPELAQSERYLAFAIFLLAFSYLYLFRRYSTLDPDEGIILQGAQRILDGQVLYRDFFSFFTPGSYYLFALVFRFFGNSYVVAHVALAFFGAAFSPITYLLARRVCSRQASLLVTGLMTVSTLPWRFVVIHNWDSTFWACLAMYCAVRFLESPSMAWAFAAASFTSLAALSEQSKGVGLLLGLVAGFLIVASSSREKLFTRDRLIAIGVGLVWPFLVTVAYFASRHTMATMLASWFWPLQHYSSANRVPYGYDNMTGEARHRLFDSASPGIRLFAMLVFSARTWIPYLPLFGAAVLARLTFSRWRRVSISPVWAYYVLVSATISGLLLSIVIARADYLHFIYLQPIFFLVLAWLFDGRGIRHPLFIRFAPELGFFLSMSLLAVAAQLLFQAGTTNFASTRRGAIATQAPDPVIGYVQADVAPGENILVYPYQPTYYYLTHTYNPTRFDFYQPGMHTDQQLNEMLADFSHHRTRVVLYEPNFTQHMADAWPNTPPGAYARDAMAEYIKHEYRDCAALNRQIVFMMRRDLPCPSQETTSSSGP